MHNLAKAREIGKMGHTSVRDFSALPEFKPFERGQSAQNFQAAIGDFSLACVVALQICQICDVPRCRVARFLAVHAPQTFKVFTSPHVPESSVANVHRQKLTEGRKMWQLGESRVVNVLRTQRDAAKRRHSFERRKSSPC